MAKTGGTKVSVQDIVIDRIIKQIQEEKRLPWQKPFKGACMNWFSEREYTGINKILLKGGEYITVNQLKQYNAKNKTNFWFEKGTPWEIVVFYSKTDKIISQGELEAIKKKNPDWSRYVKKTEKGWVRTRWVLKYYRVYNILHMKDKEGNTLEPKIGKTIHESHTPAEEIIDLYTKGTGVKVTHDVTGKAYYTEMDDAVHLSIPEYFEDSEAYYRVMFHELTHSTGVKSRLARQCFETYHAGDTSRSKEELVAEVGSLLLASEAGFTNEDSKWAENSMSYIQSWCDWMKDNKAQVINGVIAAEKAKNFILSGGTDLNASSDRDLNNPDQKQEGADAPEDVLDEGDEIEDSTESSSSTESTNSASTKDESTKSKSIKEQLKEIKTKDEVKLFYNNVLGRLLTNELPIEERKSQMREIILKDINRMFKIMTRKALPQGIKKSDALLKLSSLFEM